MWCERRSKIFTTESTEVPESVPNGTEEGSLGTAAVYIALHEQALVGQSECGVGRKIDGVAEATKHGRNKRCLAH